MPLTTQKPEGHWRRARCPTAPRPRAEPTPRIPRKQGVKLLQHSWQENLQQPGRAERGRPRRASHLIRPPFRPQQRGFKQLRAPKRPNVRRCLTAVRLAPRQNRATHGAAPKQINAARGRTEPRRAPRGNRREKGEPPTHRRGRPRPAGRAGPGQAAPPRGRGSAGSPRAREAGCRRRGGRYLAPAERRKGRARGGTDCPRFAPPALPRPPGAPPRAAPPRASDGPAPPGSPPPRRPPRPPRAAEWSLEWPGVGIAAALVSGTAARFAGTAAPLPRSRFGIPPHLLLPAQHRCSATAGHLG